MKAGFFSSLKKPLVPTSFPKKIKKTTSFYHFHCQFFKITTTHPLIAYLLPPA